MDEKLYTKALKFLARRPRSEKEIRENLLKAIRGKRFKLSDEILRQAQDDINLIVDRLKEQKFLDDKNFAEWWTQQRQLLRPTGWRVLMLELQQKGIDKEILEELRFKIQNSREETETEAAFKLAEKRFKRLIGAPKDEIYRKIGGFLGRRGFDLDTIKAVIDQLLQK